MTDEVDAKKTIDADETVARGPRKNESTRLLTKVTESDLPVRFDIKRVLGSGGMGKVYAAHDRHLGRDVAVKVLPEELRRDPEVKARFLREARSAAKLRHPGIVAVFDLDPEAGFIVMELVEGQSLSELRNQHGRLPPKEVRRIGQALLEALAAAHAVGIVHRDVKPANVMIAKNGAVKLVDFGIATFGGGGDLTQPGTAIGTPSYMPPEQLRGQTTDARSDVYAAGVTLFEVAAGTRLHTQGSSVEDPRAAIEAATGDPTLARALGKALEPKPEDRFPTAEAFARALDPRVARARRTRLAAGLAALAVVGAVGGFVGPRLTAPPALPVVAMLPFEDHSGEARLDFAEAGLPKALGDELKARLGVPVVSYYRLLNEVGSVNAPRADWEAAAARAGATFVVHGELLATSNGVDVAVTVRKPQSPKELWRTTRHARVEDVPGLVRGLAPEIAKAAGFRGDARAAPTVRSFAYEQAMLRAHAAMGEHRFSDAQERLTDAADADPTAPDPYYYRALVYWWTAADEQRTLAAIDAAEKLPITDAQRAFLGGLRQLEKLNHPAAQLRFTQALEAHPNDPDNLYGLAEAEFHGGYAREGIATYRRLCVLDPSWALGLFHAMDQYSARGDAEGLAWLLDRNDVKRDPQYGIWKVRAPFSLRDTDGAVKQALGLLDAEPAGPMSAPALEIVRVLVKVYLVRGDFAEAQTLIDGVAATLQPRLALDRVGIALLQGRPSAEIEAELTTICDAQPSPLARLFCWSPLLDVELPRGRTPRLALIAGRILANSPQPTEQSTNLQVIAALLAGVDGDDARLKQAATSRFPEAAAIAQAFQKEKAHELTAAKDLWLKAMDATTEGRWLIIEAWQLAQNRRAAADPAGVIAACTDVLQPRAFRYSWAATAGPCLLWSAEAHLKLNHPEQAKPLLDRLMQMRIAAPSGDPLILEAKRLLLTL